jgi:exonuclease SbcC
VCGSADHPNPAISHDNEDPVTQDNLNKVRLQVALEEKFFQKSRDKHLESAQKIKHQEQIIAEQEIRIGANYAAKALNEVRAEQSVFEDLNSFVLALTNIPAIAALDATVTAHRQSLTAIKAQIELLETELKEKTQPEMAVIEEEVKIAKAELDAKTTILNDLKNRSEVLVNLLNNLEQQRIENATLDAEYAIYGTLSDVASGRTGGRVNLQRFVLSVLLDDVLIQASQRLSIMSRGRYQLYRSNGVAGSKKLAGLELEVEDSFTGKNRPVATLSGGESFMAALALALGLSDIVQSYAGGIRLETLFIDEGFGSLDPESLELAIRTLIDLQSTGRTIGIISHVNELKDQMALRIDVNVSKRGSSIQVKVT